jgi:hypothetical protein
MSQMPPPYQPYPPPYNVYAILSLVLALFVLPPLGIYFGVFMVIWCGALATMLIAS